MNLLERAQKQSHEIAALEGLKKRADQASLFEKRALDWGAPAVEMKKLESAIEVMTELGIQIPLLDRALNKSLYDRITNLRERYLIDKNAVLDPFPGEDVRFVLNQPLNSLPSKVKKALLSAWEAWAKNKIPKIDDDILNILNSISSLRDSVANVRRLKVRVEEICTSLPSVNNDIFQLENLCSEIADKWHNLAGDGIPNSVLEFLRATGGREGAGLDSLTQVVLDWLTQHHIHNSLRIRMG